MASKKDKPETQRQASTWENVTNRYEAAGLCRGCAGQAAYGHQLGFNRVKDPCDPCRGVVLPGALIAKHGDRGAMWLAGHYTKVVG